LSSICQNRFFGDGLTALVRAASNGHAAVVDLLIKAGADKDAKDFVSVTQTFIDVFSDLLVINEEITSS